MALKEWDPEEATVESLEEELKSTGLSEEPAANTKPEMLPEPESFLEVVEEEEEDEEPEIVAEEEDDEEEPEAKKAPRRDRRIDQLTAQRREAEREAAEAKSQLAALNSRMMTLEGNRQATQVDNFRKAYDENKAALRRATEDGDTDTQVELTEKLADMRASARIMDMQNAQKAEAAAAAPQQQPQQEEVAAPPQEAMRWWNQNRWFNSPGNEAETAAARVYDEQLDKEGYDKDSPEYYEELNSRLQKKFPTLNSNQATKGTRRKSPTAPTKGQGTRKAKSAGRLSFTRGELDVAKSLGLTTPAELKEYRKELDLNNGGK